MMRFRDLREAVLGIAAGDEIGRALHLRARIAHGDARPPCSNIG